MNKLHPFSNPPIKASSLIGTDVVNPDGENIGYIKEVVVNPGARKVAYAVVAFDGFLEVEEKLFSIPFGALAYEAGEKKYKLDISKDGLETGVFRYMPSENEFIVTHLQPSRLVMNRQTA